MKFDPPVLNQNYERYKQELAAWRRITDVPKKNQGIAVALTLPCEHTSGIRGRVFEELEVAELAKETGLDTLIDFMNKHLSKDNLTDTYEKFEKFEDFSRAGDMTIVQYISEFHQRYNRLLKLNMTLPMPILAFKLLKCAKLTKEEHMLVLTGVNFDEKDNLYEQAKTSLKKFLGECNGKSEPTIKLDPAFLAEHKETLRAAGYVKKRSDQWESYDDSNLEEGEDEQWRGNERYRQLNNENESPQNTKRRNKRKLNPTGPDGRRMLCNVCGSYRHLMAECPDSWENQTPVKMCRVDKDNDIAVLFTGTDMGSTAELRTETQNCAILDSACTSTVCGKKWIEAYKKSLNDEDLKKIIEVEGKKVFNFGGGVEQKSLCSYIIPIKLAGKNLSLKTDVVESDIPLLLSSSSMKKAKIKMNTENDTAEILGITVKMRSTSSGHYCIPVSKSKDMNWSNPRAKHGYVSMNARANTIPKARKRSTLNSSPEFKCRNKATHTMNKEYSSNTDDDWKHIVVIESIQDRTKQCGNLYRVMDQSTRQEFSLKLDAITPGTRLIRK